MNWACEFTSDAEKDLRELPRDIQERVARALEQLSVGPFQGDVKPLKGREWKGVFRRRIGAYRILFTANHKTSTLTILRVLLRSEKTYR